VIAQASACAWESLLASIAAEQSKLIIFDENDYFAQNKLSQEAVDIGHRNKSPKA
jgi:hypothetical protein